MYGSTVNKYESRRTKQTKSTSVSTRPCSSTTAKQANKQAKNEETKHALKSLSRRRRSRGKPIKKLEFILFRLAANERSRENKSYNRPDNGANHVSSLQPLTTLDRTNCRLDRGLYVSQGDYLSICAHTGTAPATTAVAAHTTPAAVTHASSTRPAAATYLP